jgi:hypothetical protein
MLALAIGVATNVIAAIAAYFAAERRGRSTSWAALALFFSPLLLILVFLPRVHEPAHRRRFAIPLEVFGSILLVTVRRGVR